MISEQRRFFSEFQRLSRRRRESPNLNPFKINKFRNKLIDKKECDEVCSSPRHQPIKSLMLKMLETAGYGICNICGNLIAAKKEWTTNISQGIEKGYLFYYEKKLPSRRVLFSQQKKPTKWVNICGDCIRNLDLTEP